MQVPVQSGMAAGAPGAEAGGPRGAGLHIDIQSGHADSGQFRAMLDQHLQAGAIKAKPDSQSLGSALAQRTSNLASEVKQDQLHVSKLLEQATRTGDSMQLMKAMMALNDYQLRVQTISKTVSKAASSIDALTKLQ
jgi:hypothetical protein